MLGGKELCLGVQRIQKWFFEEFDVGSMRFLQGFRGFLGFSFLQFLEFGVQGVEVRNEKPYLDRFLVGAEYTLSHLFVGALPGTLKRILNPKPRP